MKKVFKIIASLFFGILLLLLLFGFYTYKTNDRIRAMIHNDESTLCYFPSKELKDLSSLSVTEIPLKVEDTITVYNYFFTSEVNPPKANIFLVHGAGGNVTFYKELIRPLVKNGYNVYASEWRGYGKSNGKPNYKNVITDTQKSFNDFKQKTQTDSLKTVVLGFSLGGQVATKIALDNENAVAALILEGSIQSAQQIAIDYTPVDFLKSRLKNSPEKFNQDYVAQRDIAKISIPKLIIHSKNDSEVSFSHGETIFKNANEPKEFWQTDTKHILTLIEYPTEMISKIDMLIK